ncbi:MAG: NUDIX hydrolase, partial [Gammaproteobacteria bacterium]|nr:NUDIX hydrolase [Gammaproteobacteria bacterium]
MKTKMLIFTALVVSGLYVNDSLAKDLPEGYWSLEQATEVQNKTRKVMLDPDLSSLSDAELAAVEKLIKVGVIF